MQVSGYSFKYFQSRKISGKINSDNELVDSLIIPQQNGVDTEDRILKFKNWNENDKYFV